MFQVTGAFAEFERSMTANESTLALSEPWMQGKQRRPGDDGGAAAQLQAQRSPWSY